MDKTVSITTPSCIPRSAVTNGTAITVQPKPVIASKVKEKKMTNPESKIACIFNLKVLLPYLFQ